MDVPPVKIQVCSIGSELLQGATTNTNLQFIAHNLIQKGYGICKAKEISDEKESLYQELRQALEESDLVITTGGLGPTFDDLTKSVLCKLFDTKLVINTKLQQELKDLPLDSFAKEHQALQPEGAEILPNAIGTAPGLFLLKGKKGLIALPGVPIQMQQIFVESVIAVIQKHYPITDPLIFHEMHIALLNENAFESDLKALSQQYPMLEMGIYPAYGFLTIRIKGRKSREEEIKQVSQSLKKKFGSYLYSESSPKLEEAFHHKMIAKGKTFALAESCTGGFFSAKLCAIPDASKYFLGSMVTYSNASKQVILGINQEIITNKGAVSKECVEAMAKGLIDRLNPDYLAAITGIAGPSGGSKEKPVGTIWICYGPKENLQTEQVPVLFRFNRALLIEYTINYTLAKLVLEQ